MTPVYGRTSENGFKYTVELAPPCGGAGEEYAAILRILGSSRPGVIDLTQTQARQLVAMLQSVIVERRKVDRRSENR